MTKFARTLWDLLGLSPAPAAPGARGARRARPAPPRDPSPPRASAMIRRYDALVEEMKQRYGVRVRKWRTSSSGCAWIVRYSNGEERRLIESPKPRGPMSCAIFLHEIGHHAIGFGRYRPRCLEEYHAWQWALNAMRERGFAVTDRVQQRVSRSLRYAVAKARRRGLMRLPPELEQYADHLAGV